jgi:hypothetical protein
VQLASCGLPALLLEAGPVVVMRLRFRIHPRRVL